ncbi:hypothetical protein HDU83_001655 [Entophlyctis luteolus]|nr:hypothetical protein HDU83_001655 [Entophlyctis luteolus]
MLPARRAFLTSNLGAAAIRRSLSASSSSATRPPLQQCWKCGKLICTPSPTCSHAAAPPDKPLTRTTHFPTPTTATDARKSQVADGGSGSQGQDAGSGSVQQPVLPWATFFDVFGIDTSDPVVDGKTAIVARKGFDIDIAVMRLRFLALQQIVHPDANALRSPKEREFSERQSVFINKAYQALRDPLTRAKYIVSKFRNRAFAYIYDFSYSAAFEQGKATAGMTTGELMKIMDIWEAIEEVEDEAGLAELTKENEDRIKGELAKLKQIFGSVDGTVEQAKEIVVRLQYWTSLRQRLRDVSL